MQINIEDLPTDPADIEQDAQDFFDGEGVEPLVETVIILGQLDPTEIDLTTGRPRWTAAQMSVITRAKAKLSDWQE